MKRHDYLPFGEELFAGTGGRTAGQGYIPESIRQQFTQQERDTETNLDYFGARYYASGQGRFVSVDPLLASGRVNSPQSWNRYSYVLNNPLRFVDPTGLAGCTPESPCVQVPESEWLTVAPVVDGGTVTVEDSSISEIFTTSELASEVNSRPTQSAASSDDCLYCGSLSVEMQRRAEPMAEVIEAGAAADVAIMAAPLALGEVGATSLGLDFEAETAMLEEHLGNAVAQFEAEGFTPAQEAALENNPNLEAAFRGSRIDQFFKEAVSADERLSHLNITPRFSFGPDVYHSASVWWDVTTQAQWGAHVAKYAAEFGQGVPLIY